MRKLSDSVFFAPFLLIMIVSLISGGFTFFLPIHLSAIGLSGWQIGMLFAATILAGLILQFFIGVLTDRLAIKWVAIAGFVLLAGYLFGFSVATTFAAMLIVFVLRGISEPALQLSLESFTLKKAENNMRIGRFVLLKCSALAIGIVLCGLLIFSLDFPFAMQIAAIAALLSIILALRIRSVPGSVEPLNVYFKGFAKPNILFFALLIFLFGSHWGVEQTSYGLFLKENLSLTTQGIGVFMGVPILFLGLGGAFFGRMRDRGMTFKQLLAIAFILSGGAFAAMALVQDVQLAFLFRILHEMGDGAWNIFVFAGSRALFPTERMGGSYGLIAFSGLLGAATGMLVYGPLGDALGYHVPHIISGALVVGATTLLPLLRLDPEPVTHVGLAEVPEPVPDE